MVEKCHYHHAQKNENESISLRLNNIYFLTDIGPNVQFCYLFPEIYSLFVCFHDCAIKQVNAETNIVNIIHLTPRYNKWCWHLDTFAFMSPSDILNNTMFYFNTIIIKFISPFLSRLLYWHSWISIPFRLLYFKTYVWSIFSMHVKKVHIC